MIKFYCETLIATEKQRIGESGEFSPKESCPKRKETKMCLMNTTEPDFDMPCSYDKEVK